MADSEERPSSDLAPGRHAAPRDAITQPDLVTSGYRKQIFARDWKRWSGVFSHPLAFCETAVTLPVCQCPVVTSYGRALEVLEENIK